MRKLIFIYLFIFILFTLIYTISFHTLLFNQQEVLFYRGLILLTISTVILLILIALYYFKISKKNIESLLAALAITAAFHLSFFVVFPVTFERSVTMFLLNTLRNNDSTSLSCQGLSKQQLKDKLINDYIINNDAVQKRIEEQKVINFIDLDKSCIKLTNKARSFLDFSLVINKIYGIK